MDPFYLWNQPMETQRKTFKPVAFKPVQVPKGPKGITELGTSYGHSAAKKRPTVGPVPSYGPTSAHGSMPSYSPNSSYDSGSSYDTSSSYGPGSSGYGSSGYGPPGYGTTSSGPPQTNSMYGVHPKVIGTAHGSQTYKSEIEPIQMGYHHVEAPGRLMSYESSPQQVSYESSPQVPWRNSSQQQSSPQQVSYGSSPQVPWRNSPQQQGSPQQGSYGSSPQAPWRNSPQQQSSPQQMAYGSSPPQMSYESSPQVPWRNPPQQQQPYNVSSAFQDRPTQPIQSKWKPPELGSSYGTPPAHQPYYDNSYFDSPQQSGTFSGPGFSQHEMEPIRVRMQQMEMGSNFGVDYKDRNMLCDGGADEPYDGLTFLQRAKVDHLFHTLYGRL